MRNNPLPDRLRECRDLPAAGRKNRRAAAVRLFSRGLHDRQTRVKLYQGPIGPGGVSMAGYGGDRRPQTQSRGVFGYCWRLWRRSMNLKRRHLNESQRAMIAAKIANLHVGNPSFNSANLPNRVSNTTAAELLNVSERTVRSAKSVQEHAAKPIIEAVENNFQKGVDDSGE